jgi:hypothetical protein
MQLSSVRRWRNIPCCVFLGVHGREGREEAFSHSKSLATRSGSGGRKAATAVAVVGDGANVVLFGWSVGTGAHMREGSGVVHRARRLSKVLEIPNYGENLKDSRKIV